MSDGHLRVIGQRVPMLEAPDKVSGRAVFTHDVARPGLLHGRVVRSPLPHARIRAIDVSEARRLPGVVDVVTAAETAKRRYQILGGPFSDRFPLAVDRVRFVGEEVAAVAAEDPRIAEEAVQLVHVEYERLPAVFTPEEAMAPEAPVLHGPEHCLGGPNVALRSTKRFGDPETALRDAHRVFEHTFRYPTVLQAAMETNATVCELVDGVLQVWTATQVPLFVRHELAHVLDFPEERIRLLPVAVGGGFGARSKICEQEAICALLALRTGRPVRLVNTREEEFGATKSRHAMTITLRTGVAAGGRIVARDARALVDNGAYTHMGPGVMGYAGLLAAAVYRTPHALSEGTLVYTNKQPGGQYRGFGATQMTFALESQIDMMADALGIDPLAFRRQNATRPGDVTSCGWKITTCGLDRCLQAAADRIGWDGKRRERAPFRGVGLAAGMHVSGANVYPYGDFSEAVIEIDEAGRVRVITGSADAGTGSNTMLAMIAAETLAVPVERVTVLSMDTAEAPPEMGAWASRFTMLGGNAARVAAEQTRATLLAAGADLLEAAPEDVRLADGELSVVGSPGRRLTFADVVRARGPIREHGRFDAPSEPLDQQTGYANISAAYSFAAHAVEVEVSPDTGRVRILRYVAAHDCGRALNPMAVEGQIQGAVAMGLGAALQEHMGYEGGRLVQRSFLDYKIPLATDIPPIEVELVETDDRVGPFGGKSVGELGLIAAAPAVANAVAHAIGVRFTELPITPDRVLAVLAARGGKPPAGADPRRHPSLWRVAGVRALYPRLVFPLLREYGARVARRPARALRFTTDRPASLAELGKALDGPGGPSRVMGGGTDLMAGMRQGIYAPERIVDLAGIPELSTIQIRAEGLQLGAGVSLARVGAQHEVRERFPSLARAIAHLATPQIRNMATVGGNLCQQKRCWFFRGGFLCYKNGGWTCPCYAVLGDNRHHAVIGADRCAAVGPSDLATVLTALDATVLVWSAHRERRVPVEEFYRGPGEPDLRPDEILRAVLVPWPAPWTIALWEKVAPREGDFATVSTAVTLVTRGDLCLRARVVLGGVAASPHRARAAEALLEHARITPDRAVAAAATVLERALPLAGNAYKIDMARRLVARTLGRAFAGMERRSSMLRG